VPPTCAASTPGPSSSMSTPVTMPLAALSSLMARSSGVNSLTGSPSPWRANSGHGRPP
jgi:hypothetical protein